MTAEPLALAAPRQAAETPKEGGECTELIKRAVTFSSLLGRRDTACWQSWAEQQLQQPLQLWLAQDQGADPLFTAVLGHSRGEVGHKKRKS